MVGVAFSFFGDIVRLAAEAPSGCILRPTSPSKTYVGQTDRTTGIALKLGMTYP